jgi:putative oxidoreductase
MLAASVAHGLLKRRGYTMPGTVAFFRSLGLTALVAYVVTAVELIGGGCLVLGIAPRYVALLLVPEIVGTISAAHGKNGWLISGSVDGWEFPAFWAATLVAQFLLGDGAWTLIPPPSLSSLMAAVH